MAGRVVVITGGSRGIGASLAEQLTAAGTRVALVGRHEDALRAEAQRCHGLAESFVADVTKRAEVTRLVAAVLEKFGRVDVWVNNVGVGIFCMPTQLTDDDIDEMMRQNVKTALYGMQEILPHFKARGEGHIINISSLLGRTPYVVFRSAYSGAKHFLNAITANMRMEIQETHPGIQVSTVSPGVVRTEFGLHALHGGPDNRQLPNSQSAEEVAAVIAGVIESRRPDVYTRPAREWIVKYYEETGEDP